VTRPIRVLAVDHTAGVRPFRKKFEAIATQPGIELTVLAPERWIENYREIRADDEAGSGYGFRLGRVGWPGYENRAFFYRGLGRAIRDARPDILHLWEEPFSAIALQALILASIWAPRAAPIFFSSDNLSRGFRYSYRPSAFYAAVERYAHRRCVAGTAVSQEVVDVLRSKGFTKPVEVIPHGIDLVDYPKDSTGNWGRRASREEVLARFGLEAPIVGFTGRLLRQKGVELVLRAIAGMGATRPSLVIMGDGPEREALEREARDLGIEDRTLFLRAVPHGEMPAVLASIDVLVVPSRTTPKWKEQFGRVLIEGMAAGCITIGSTSGAIPEVLDAGGIVVEEGSVEGLISAMRLAISNEKGVASIREKARARVEERYTWEAIAKRIVSLYGSITPGLK